MPSLCRTPVMTACRKHIYMTYPFWSLTQPVLSVNRVSYDTSTMVRSLLAHLLILYLTSSKSMICQCLFHIAQYQFLERTAPCGGLIGEPTLSLSKGHPENIISEILSSQLQLCPSSKNLLSCTLDGRSGHTTAHNNMHIPVWVL